MISHLFLHQGRGSFFILAFTSSIGKCDAARVILAILIFSSLTYSFSHDSITECNLVSVLMKRASKAKGDAYWNILSFAVRCLSFMITTPAVTREIITTYMQSLVIEGARLMKESGRFHSDVLEGMSFLAPENHAILVDTSEKLFLEIIKGGDLFEICVVLEICELLTGPFGGGIREWINVADNVFDQCADLLEVLLPNSRFLCERMLWRKKISIESVIRRHAIDSISLPTIRSVFNVAYASHFESLRRGTLYNKVQDIKLE